MTAPADSAEHIICFFIHFFLLLLIIAIVGVYSESV